MLNPDPAVPQFPAPSGPQFLSLIRNAADVVLLLDKDQRVVDVIPSDTQQAGFPATWAGQHFTDLLSVESRSKADSLFAQDVSVVGTKARWRHLNLSDGKGGTVPLLLKFAGLRGGDNPGGLLMARDLRPTVELQDRFRISHQELESKLGALQSTSAPRPGNTAPESSSGRVGGVIVADMMAKLGHRPLDGIMRETSRILERLCVTEALGRAHGDRDQAARLLGITVEELHLAMMN
ncbi:MAG: hypothetical protein ACK4GT_06835 [Pararhodobacter sp.]